MVVHARVTNSDSIWQSKQSSCRVYYWSWLAALYLNRAVCVAAELMVGSLVRIEGGTPGKADGQHATNYFYDQSTHFGLRSKRSVSYFYLVDIRRVRHSEKTGE